MSVDLVRRWVGTPYSEVECWGLVCAVAAELGKPMPVLPDIFERASQKVAYELSTGHWKRVDTPTDGTIVKLSPMHVGIWVCGGVLHTARKFGATWQDLTAIRRAGYQFEFLEFQP